MALRESESRKGAEDKAFAETVERARRGDLAAFERIMALHERKVLRAAQALLGNREDASDAAQEVFLRVFRYLNRFDTARPFGPWLYRVVVNVCRDIHRKRRRVPAAQIEDLDAALLASDGGQEVRLDAADRARILRGALAVLSDKEREALVLRDIEGLSTREVALSLGCLEVTVRSHLSRARLKLRSAVAKLMGDRA